MDRREFIKLGTAITLSIATVNIGLLSQDGGDDFWELVLKRVGDFEIKKLGHSAPRPIGDHYVTKYPPREGYIFSHDFFHLSVAKEWGLAPSELSGLSIDDQINMYAWCIAIRQIQEVEKWEVSRKMNKHNA